MKFDAKDQVLLSLLLLWLLVVTDHIIFSGFQMLNLWILKAVNVVVVNVVIVAQLFVTTQII